MVVGSDSAGRRLGGTASGSRVKVRAMTLASMGRGVFVLRRSRDGQEIEANA